MSTPFKMTGFSGFGNSPIKQKATFTQKVKSLTKTVFDKILNEDRSFSKTYTKNKASLKKSDLAKSRKNKTVDGITYDGFSEPTSKHYPYDNATFEEKGE